MLHPPIGSEAMAVVCAESAATWDEGGIAQCRSRVSALKCEGPKGESTKSSANTGVDVWVRGGRLLFVAFHTRQLML